MNENEHNPGDSVLAKIRAGEVRMHSKGFFLLRAAASILAALLILLLSSFIVSFLLFSLERTGEAFLLGFGLHGIIVFLTVFPWLPLSIDIALLLLLEWLLRGMTGSYRFSLVSLLAIVAVASVALALVINLFHIHPFLERSTRSGMPGGIPGGGVFYEEVRHPREQDSVLRGYVIGTTTDGFIVRTDEGSTTVRVLVPPGAPVPAIGSHVFVFGDSVEDRLEAEGVRELNRD